MAGASHGYVPPTVNTQAPHPVTNSGSITDRVLDLLIGAGSTWAAYELDRKRMEDAYRYAARYGIPPNVNGSPNLPGGGPYYPNVNTAGMFGGIPPIFLIAGVVVAGLYAFSK